MKTVIGFLTLLIQAVSLGVTLSRMTMTNLVYVNYSPEDLNLTFAAKEYTPEEEKARRQNFPAFKVHGFNSSFQYAIANLLWPEL